MNFRNVTNKLLKSRFETANDNMLLQVVDGWESENQYFPGEWDHTASSEHRYLTYCKPFLLPSSIYVSSQNAALLQFRTPIAGQGFNASVKFIPNRQRKYINT